MNDRDRLRAEAVRNASERELVDFHPNFTDERLPGLLLHYKARNFPKTLSDDERAMWQTWRAARVQAQLPKYMAALQRLAVGVLDADKEFIVQELQLWAESILPEPD